MRVVSLLARRRVLRSVLVALALALLPTGCGYSSRRLTDFPSARTIAIVPFQNTGFYRDLELELTARVVQEVRARSNLAMGTLDTADLILRGSTGAFETPVVLGENGDVIQKRLEGWLEITVTERASGRVVRSARVRATADFRPGVDGESLPGSATQTWTRRLAEQIAQTLEVGF
jgi:hypothetical protein